MITLCFLWHMHQPFYKNLWTGEYKLPWARLHALKDYTGMMEILGEFPQVRQTFNLVPSMVMQIEEFASGRASGPFIECAFLPAEDLTAAQRSFVLKYFFQVNVQRMIGRYPRYRELYDRRREKFSPQDIRDLQVLNQLVWFDEDLLARDRDLQELIRKGRDYSIGDQALLERKQIEALGRVLPVYRDFAASGQIEISTTPFYHPILPLICDSKIARVSRPDVPLPPRFRYPEDAREQLRRARGYIKEKLGTEPVGLWPSEGSVSDEALLLAADLGFTWAATDNGVLARTLDQEAGCELTYRAYVWRQEERELRLLFRDHYLSDLIGFQYSQMGAADAAGHFLWRIRENTAGRNALVPIILDGENAWEWYEANGRPFLRELYRRISEDPQLEAVTISEALARFDAHPLDRIFPGSWINANFDVWIGPEEDNRAWELLLDARRFYDRHRDSVPEKDRQLAYEELLIAEGSDWCWWYGPEHASENRPEFDQLYRDHLANVYRALGAEPPENLAHSILQAQPGAFHELPSNPLEVTLDGEVTSAFEWMGAGRYRPDFRSGAMHGETPPIREFFYGRNEERLFVRVDAPGNAELGIEFENGPAEVKFERGHILEMEAPLSGTRFRVTVAREGLPPALVPAEGWIEVG
ncbi:MAG TPA: glycoside hydrolase family 57 protein [Bryobacteraceae bacterium]|nr:glycoside hydrolase family 57 protein [Bryobacteraceae bacterium]